LREFGRTVALLQEQQMVLLFSHPTKIFFNGDRSRSIASHTYVVSWIAMGETAGGTGTLTSHLPDEAHRREPGTFHGTALLQMLGDPDRELQP
jgi:hypothetical protein